MKTPFISLGQEAGFAQEGETGFLTGLQELAIYQYGQCWSEVVINER